MCGAPYAPAHAEAAAHSQEAPPATLAQTTDTSTPNSTSDKAASTTASSTSAFPVDGHE